jgi:hypothetical protein
MRFAYPLVLVTWEDIATNGVQGTREEVLSGLQPCIRYSPGWILDNNSTYVILATDYDVRDKIPYVAGIQQFPKMVVKQITRLNVGKVYD